MTYKFVLNGNQHIESSGINFKRLGKKINDPKKYNTLKLYPCSKSSQFSVGVIVDDDEKEFNHGDDFVFIKAGQMFSLENYRRVKPCTFFVRLFRDDEE